ncbi:hypothetical protein RJ40_10440 [Methanofollis aquaemaris]|uniref:N-acetyltransferase domain-containing protein n=1 Tax=Methanofollis aquaemaris TaxID=126734 RepID=A0A8A3S832_9EURY|nr:GNAT family N-acetyltransferase [Methanofollis aquaemaris]QSZ67881.1 hypothetical protein RJ40_10440 [Methanofollis aquaemaris]
MIPGIEKIVENNFLKKRYVFLTNKEHFPGLRVPKKDESIACKIENTGDEEYIPGLLADIVDDKDVLGSIKKILTNFKNSVLISASYDGETAGCIVVLIPSEPIIYDNCKYTPDQVRFAQLYVNSKYRRRGISSHLRYAAFDYWYNHYPDRTVVGIIEGSNDASLQGAQKMNYNFGGVNYLIKFFGKNLMSVTNCTGKWEFLLLFRGTKFKRI